jgi:hypothetical protein
MMMVPIHDGNTIFRDSKIPKKSKKQKELAHPYHHVLNGKGRWYGPNAKEWSPKTDFTKTNVGDP